MRFEKKEKPRIDEKLLYCFRILFLAIIEVSFGNFFELLRYDITGYKFFEFFITNGICLYNWVRGTLLPKFTK